MANQNANVTQKRSNTPLLIIGLVLVVALLGGWWFYSSSKGGSTSGVPSPSPGMRPPKGTTIPPNAPPGAQPPNQAGSPTATVTVEEFADFQCPQCALQHPNMNEIKSMYGSHIHFIFREFPLDIKAHDKSYDAAVAAEAAGLQGKFWEMQNMLFTNQKTWTEDPNFKQTWRGYAQKIGLDIEKWETDIAGMAAKGRIDLDKKRGQAIGINATPAIYVNGTAVTVEQMTVNGIKGLIDAELAKGSQSQQPQGGQVPANGPATRTDQTAVAD